MLGQSLLNGLMALVLVQQPDSVELHHQALLQDFSPLYPQVTFAVDESNPFIHGSVRQEGAGWAVTLSGGLMSDGKLSDDAFRMIACHELGHIRGGAPRMNWRFEEPVPPGSDEFSPVAAEGQADYYATLKCMRRLLKSRAADFGSLGLPVDSVVANRCGLAFAASDDVRICERSAMAALEMLRAFRAQGIGFETPSSEVVERTNRDLYPSKQCRLDTLFAGALCAADSAIETDPVDETRGVCLSSRGEEDGARPACWFRELL